MINLSHKSFLFLFTKDALCSFRQEHEEPKHPTSQKCFKDTILIEWLPASQDINLTENMSIIKTRHKKKSRKETVWKTIHVQLIVKSNLWI